MFVDSHTHVQFAAYRADREEVIKRALEKGIWMVNVGTQYSTSKSAIELAEKYPEGLYATVGFHPLNIEKTYNDPQEAPEVGQEAFDIERLRELASHPKVVAIGECGLDLKNQKSPPEADPPWAGNIKIQEEVFLAQLELAKEIGKPIVIHCRGAHERMIELLSPEPVEGPSTPPPSDGAPLRQSLRGVVHFFTGTVPEAKRYQELGFFVSFGGVITFTEDYTSVVAQVPLEQILLETDAPYVAPVPYRGKRNEPAYVEEVAKKIARVKGISFEEVARVTTENVKKLFELTKLTSG